MSVSSSSNASPQPSSVSTTDCVPLTSYHDIILDLFREFCKAYPAGFVEHRGCVFLYHNFEEVFRSLIWHQVENDKKERDEEKVLNEGCSESTDCPLAFSNFLCAFCNSSSLFSNCFTLASNNT
ncbi:hypothetical protein Pst134EA_032632 [Puccinia striiformis f. sp. tritici]|uniref:uncharacterized protein n=1 Tax=Puccinia striiformis f. sp. tritici TaxID=168172 RepID=UPI00200800B7|nr:uncharacterized protein Pst134EA_032632 [Puccinia striiformis f. sp. tritici]KAH9443567.1 hypothetical protein Pst134EA_032632 [Puccinia striiformis f. sp. tritici]